jgi:hypothetical protein
VTRRSYAVDTDVPVSRSKSHLEDLLAKYGADQFLSGWAPGFAVIGFRLQARQYRIKLPLPDKPKPDAWDVTRKTREYEQTERSRWRALVLVLKAKLVAVDSGISTIEREFLSDAVLPDGVVIWEWLHPQLKEAYASGRMPTLLPGLSSVPELPRGGEIVDAETVD